MRHKESQSEHKLNIKLEGIKQNRKYTMRSSKIGKV